jgi:hypothetical protein
VPKCQPDIGVTSSPRHRLRPGGDLGEGPVLYPEPPKPPNESPSADIVARRSLRLL